MSTRKKKILTILLSACIALLVGEAALRLFLPMEFQRLRYYRLYKGFPFLPGTTSYHPELGFFSNPNLDVPFTTSEFNTRVTTNSRGFRDDEESLTDPEALFLGDSIGFGWGVENDESCANVFERRTGLRTLNMGVTGYNNVQELLLLKKFCQEADYRDRLVVILVFNNDLKENSWLAGKNVPRIYKSGAHALILDPGSKEDFEGILERQTPKGYESILRRSCIGDCLLRVLNPSLDALAEELEPTPLATDGSIYWVNRGESLELVFRQIRSYCEERSLRLLAPYIPRQLEVKSGAPDPDSIAARQVFSTLEIPSMDLSKVLNEDDYYSLDGHLNPVGHRKMAEAIADSLNELGWIKDSPQSPPVAAILPKINQGP